MPRFHWFSRGCYLSAVLYWKIIFEFPYLELQGVGTLVASEDQRQDTPSFQIQDLVNCLLCHLSLRLWLKALMSSLHPRRTSLKSQRRLLAAVLDFASRLLLILEACWAQPLRLGTHHKWRHCDSLPLMKFFRAYFVCFIFHYIPIYITTFQKMLFCLSDLRYVIKG